MSKSKIQNPNIQPVQYSGFTQLLNRFAELTKPTEPEPERDEKDVYQNQRVELTQRQATRLEIARLSKLMERFQKENPAEFQPAQISRSNVLTLNRPASRRELDKWSFICASYIE